MGEEGGLGFYLGFCNDSFFKVTPLIWAIEDQNNESYRGGVWSDWDGFPTFTGFEL